MKSEEKIIHELAVVLKELTEEPVNHSLLRLQPTRKEFEGDFTLVVFPFVKLLRQSPEQIGRQLGTALMERMPEISSFNVIKGFLNLSLKPEVWLSFLAENWQNASFGLSAPLADRAMLSDGASVSDKPPLVLEFSSPNTNKPLHLGHIRNNLLGDSMSRILKAAGENLIKVNLVNDRGIHICKSMLAWKSFFNGITPAEAGLKGDRLVGDCYVRFERELKNQVRELKESQGLDEETAREQSSLMQQARALLRKWEERDEETMATWKQMNAWVYEGFDATYARLGIAFDKIYYESQTYLLGREIVKEALSQGLLQQKEDGSVWADLRDAGLDEKLLLRSDGTSVYMTQDLGTAQLRHDDFHPSKMIYVVGNEQNYHFEVLRHLAEKLGKPWAGAVYHLSYGMVELPQGRMKSREGTVVDADDLMDEMTETARRTTEALGKTDDFTEEEKKNLYHILGMGALKYFILKVDPRKNMLFNPEESIDFNGHTGPFIQYTHARIRSIVRAAGAERMATLSLDVDPGKISSRESGLLKTLYQFPETVQESASTMSPAIVAQYVYELARAFNQFYHDHSVLNEPERSLSDFRLQLSVMVANIIRSAMGLLGIEVPERM